MAVQFVKNNNKWQVGIPLSSNFIIFIDKNMNAHESPKCALDSHAHSPLKLLKIDSFRLGETANILLHPSILLRELAKKPSRPPQT